VIPRNEPNPGLYQAVLDAPDDDGPRLAYADWLEDNGDPDRAQFIRLQCHLERTAPSSANYQRLQVESSHLLARGRKRWLGGRKNYRGVEWNFLRGFPEAVYVSSFEALRAHEAEIFRHPVQRVSFAEEPAFAEFVTSPILARVRELDLSYCHLTDAAARRLAASPHLRQLTWLSLANNSLTPAGAEALAAADMPLLRDLDLSQAPWHEDRIGPRGAQSLAGSPLGARLVRLFLGSCGIGDEGLRALAVSPHLQGLTDLDLRHNNLTEAGLAAVVERRAWPGLRALALSNNSLRDAGARRLASAAHWDQLEALELAGCDIGDAGAAALAGAPFAALRHLELRHNLIGEAGASAMGRSARLPSLREVQLAGNAVREPLAKAVAERFARQDPAALDRVEPAPAPAVAPAPAPLPLPRGKAGAAEGGLLQAIADDPDDDFTQRVYADWLEENGDPEWAEVIHLDLRPGGPADPDRRQRLADAVVARRLAPFARHVKGGAIERGVLCVAVPLRSFLARAFQAGAPGWFAEARVQGLHLTGSTRDWRGVADSPVLADVRELSLSAPAFPRAGWDALFASPHLAGLHTLQLSACATINAAMAALLAGSLPRLRRLFLPENDLGTRELTALLSWGQAVRLTTLSLVNNCLTAADAAWLANAPQLAGLRRLDLSYNNLHGAGAIALAGSPHLAGLTHLRMQGCSVEPPEAVALAESARLPRLTLLDLSNNAIDLESARALLESPGLSGARVVLAECNVTATGQRELRKRHGDRVCFSE
jgi:uncharacterized protein (TIGR02996 family)